MKQALYIPSLGHEQMDLTVKAYAMRMMKAIDENNLDSTKTYRIESSDREYDSDGSIADVISLYEKNDGDEEEIYRFYEFRYGNFLTGRFQESNILYKFMSLLFVLVTRFFSVVKSIFSFKDEINNKSKIQALYFTIIYCLLAVYLVSIIPALLGVLAGFAEHIDPLKSFAVKINAYEAEFKAVLASFATFMLLTPNSKTIFSSMATEYLAANQYLSVGDRRLFIMGKLSRLIEVIAEEEADSEIEVHCYSFGSVLAIDAIFPYESEPSTRIKNNITKLVTIGCPFDFIEIYWANYFSDRKYSNLSLRTWHNIHSDLDVLSTKFANSPVKQSKFIESEEFWGKFGSIDIKYNMVNPEQVSYTQMLLFYGLKAHQMYWDKHVDSKSCLSNIVKTV